MASSFSKEVLNIDPAAETERIVASLRQHLRTMRRYGVVVGISGGVDSSVVLALCVRAFGPQKVVALIMPEKDSNPESERLARTLAGQFGVTPILENITPVLEGFGCYPRRDEAIRRVVEALVAHGRVPRGYLKLRVVRGGVSELICYERPKRKGARESRYVKWTLDAPRRVQAQGSGSEAQASGLRARAAGDVDAALRILSAALGVETVVRKTREVYLVEGARIHLDRVTGLGTFVEIEVLMERAGRGSARLMKALCERLQLPKDATPGSYRDLLHRRN